MHLSRTWLIPLGALGSALLAAPALVAPAGAASFDCAKATTSFERAICEDGTLSARDEVLAVAYATATGGLTAEAGAAMRAGQREWLAYVERACTPEGEPLRVPYDADGVACLAAEFERRIAGLEASRMQGGHRFYLVERFLTLPRQGEEDWNKVATKSFSAVHLDGTDPLAQGFNAFVSAESAPMLADFSPPEPDAEGAEEAYSTDASNRIVVDAVSRRLIGLQVTASWYGHGAAHGNYDITYRHYLTEEARALAVADIFADAAYAGPLAEVVLGGLRAQFPGEGLWDDAPAAAADAVADPQRWSFSPEGIGFHFQPYEVTAYAAGAPKVLVPWHEMADWLDPDAEALAVY